MIKPAKLESGMTIGLIAASSSVPDPRLIDRAIEELQTLGYNVKPGKHVRGKHGYLAGHDMDRLADLHSMFSNKKVDAVMCARGGYGMARITPYIDYDLIRKQPKIFIGFSDVTVLHLAILKRCKLVTFNGPMAVFTFADHPPAPFTLDGFLRTLTASQPAGSIWQGHPDRNYRIIRPGQASGRLTGGNLSLVTSSIGSPFEIETKGRIIFLEEIDEQSYRMDRMLTQLLQAGKLADAAGIVIGRNVAHAECEEAEAAAARRRQTKKVPPPRRKVNPSYEPAMVDVFADRLRDLKIPIIYGLPFGHIKNYATLPMGVKATMDSRTGDLVIEEAAVV